MRTTIRLLILGGCHTVGYGLKEENQSFIDRIIAGSEETTGVKFVKKTISNLLFRNINVLLETVNEFQPDIIIFQMGNYESTPLIKNVVRKILWKKKQARKTSPSTGWYVGKAKLYRKTFLLSYIKYVFKEIINFVFPYSNLHSRRFYNDVIQFKNHLKSIKVEMIYLSAFPALDPFVNRCRKRFNMRHLNGLQQDNITVVDSFMVIPRELSCFQDLIHLNKDGHKIIGNYLMTIVNQLVLRRQQQTSKSVI